MAHSQMEASTEKEQLTNIYNLEVFKAEKDIVIMCFIRRNCVNRLGKAQKNGSRWMNSTLLTPTLYGVSMREALKKKKKGLEEANEGKKFVFLSTKQ